MDLLFSNGVDNIGVKVCLHNYYRRTIANLIRTIKKYYYRKFRSVLNDDEIFCSMMNGEETERILCKSYLVGVNGRSVEEVNDLARDSFVEIRNLSEKEMWTESDYFLINFRQTIQTKTDYGLKHIIFAPHFLSKKGRAEKIEKRFLVGSIRENNCSYLFDDVDERGPHLAADGYYYPYGLCPQERSMRIGHVSGSIREVLYWHNFFRSKFLQAILSDCTNRNVCEVCLGTSVKY